MIQKSVVYRASGKILIAGGYGVLQQGNKGLSLAVKNHFYSLTKFQQNNVEENKLIVDVSSPQLKSKWKYQYDLQTCSIQEINKISNPFVQKAVKYALEFSLKRTTLKISKITIKILFDRGFLSESHQQKIRSDKFLNYEPGTSKTGLGSSACVVVVVVGGIVKLLTEQWTLKDINVISQVANIAAQNKIGSNFDISTAVFGSQVYTNILPKRVFLAMEKEELAPLFEIDPQVRELSVNKILVKQSNSWLIDLRRGSNTRTMVSGFIKILHQQSPQIITAFYDKNKTFVQQIERIITSELSKEMLISKLKAFNQQYRKFLQQYSSLTKIPVEPPQFKQLLDQLQILDGIAYCLCPGSGGYDAIFVLAIYDLASITKSIDESVAQVCKKNGLQCHVSKANIEWSSSELQEKQLQDIKKYFSEIDTQA